MPLADGKLVEHPRGSMNSGMLDRFITQKIYFTKLALPFQTFGYTHFWSTDNSSEVSKRSGNPGYRRGKPVLTGFLKKNETGTNWFIQRGQGPML